MAKILIVEDNALNIKLFCDLLAAHGHEPQAVTDSRLALDAAREFTPELVITDIQLPHVSGLELIQLIRADEALKSVPIRLSFGAAPATGPPRCFLAGCRLASATIGAGMVLKAEISSNYRHCVAAQDHSVFP